MALLVNLNAYDGVAPSYANALLVELFKDGEQFLVEVSQKLKV